MVFSSLIFVWAFLPITIIIGFITRNHIKIQNCLLLLASLLFYSWGEPNHIWLFLFTILLCWLMTLISSYIKQNRIKKVLGILTISIDLLILFRFKYANWCMGNILSKFDWNITNTDILLPIGISFYTFQAISYVADVMLMNKYKAEKSPIVVGLYIAFFPQLVAGPIVRFYDIAPQIRSRKISLDEFTEGTLRFLYGFSKKVLLADSMAVIANQAFLNQANGTLTTSFSWLGAIAYTFQIYCDFSAYSDMAIGMGHMFGLKIPENFNKPYQARSMRDFWQRWHISLSTWFRDYVYIPLGGNRKSIRRTYCNIAIVWLLTGIWHGANWTFIIWGLTYGLLLILEKLLNINKKLKVAPNIYRTAYRIITFIIISVLWVIFRSSTIDEAYGYITNMLLLNNFTENMSITILYISEYKWALFACILISFVSLPPTLTNKKRLNDVAYPLLLSLFIISISYLVKGYFSPFLYFNF